MKKSANNSQKLSWKGERKGGSSMGIILTSKRENDKVVVETLIETTELLQLKGEIDNIHIFSEKVADVKSNIAKRGRNEATKYFLIPRHLRKDLDVREPVSCQRINTKDKTIFVYVVDHSSFQGYKNQGHKKDDFRSRGEAGGL
jgi:hypothetical protein